MLNLTNEECEVLRQLEEELWREETRFDRQRMDEVIAEDFFEFGMSGRFYRREDTLAIPRQPIDAVFPLPDFKARLLAPDVAQVTYNSAVTYDGVVFSSRTAAVGGPRRVRMARCGSSGTGASRIEPQEAPCVVRRGGDRVL